MEGSFLSMSLADTAEGMLGNLSSAVNWWLFFTSDYVPVSAGSVRSLL